MTMAQYDELPDNVRESIEDYLEDRGLVLETWLKTTSVIGLMNAYFEWEGIDKAYVEDVVGIVRSCGYNL